MAAMCILKGTALVLSLAVLVGGCEREEHPGPAMTAAPGGQPGGNAQAAATLEFQRRIEAYLAIHNQAEGKVPNLIALATFPAGLLRRLPDLPTIPS